MDLVEKIVVCHQHLQQAQIPHAFGGALALAWCTPAARGTIDIDINVFVGADQIDAVLNGLPKDVVWTSKDVTRLKRDLQHRLWWDSTPIDLFFNSTNYHDALAERTRWEKFADDDIPFLSCLDLAVFKVFFNRTKDWADLEAMHEAGTLDFEFVGGAIAQYLGHDDERLGKLFALRNAGISS